MATDFTPAFESIFRQRISPDSRIWPPDSKEYEKITNSYFWASSKSSPAAVFQPAVPDDIVVFFELWHKAFAVKGASHIAPPGFNSTGKDGILVDMSLFKDIQLDEDAHTVSVGAGLVWTELYDWFVKNGKKVNVNGATSCQGVGVAGFVLGGGYGNKCGQYGLAMDCIEAIDIVTPTGKKVTTTVKEATPGTLFWALRGGGNNFGIVTKWTLKTHDQPYEIYHARYVYEEKYFSQVQAAIMAYHAKQAEHPAADVETMFEWTVDPETGAAKAPHAVAECYYDSADVPEGFFKEFEDIPQTQNGILTTPITTWPDFIASMPDSDQTLRWGVMEGVHDLANLELRGRYTCVMLTHYTAPLLQKVVGTIKHYSQFLPDHGGVQIYPAIKPVNPNAFKDALPAAWPHSASQVIFLLPMRIRWTDPKEDKFWLDILRKMTQEIKDFALKEGCTTEDIPMYYNLALEGTPTEEIYKENLKTLQEFRATIDPKRVMDRTGGFRI